MQTLLNMMTDPVRIRAKRDSYMEAARACKATLTDPNSYWTLSADDERVKHAVGAWVAKARAFNRQLIGVAPVIPNFHYITPMQSISGDLYVA
jgi:hypothetical protein